LAKSDFKVRREAGFFTIVSLSHAEYVARGASLGIADYDEAPEEKTVANDPGLAVFPARVFHLNRGPFEDECGIFEVEATIIERARTLRRIERHAHKLL
jgi:hypothetical protein